MEVERIDEKRFVEEVKESIRNAAEYLIFLTKKLQEDPLGEKSPGVVLEIERVAKILRETEEAYLAHIPKVEYQEKEGKKYEILYYRDVRTQNIFYIIRPVTQGDNKKREMSGYG